VTILKYKLQTQSFLISLLFLIQKSKSVNILLIKNNIIKVFIINIENCVVVVFKYNLLSYKVLLLFEIN